MTIISFLLIYLRDLDVLKEYESLKINRDVKYLKSLNIDNISKRSLSPLLLVSCLASVNFNVCFDVNTSPISFIEPKRFEYYL